MHDPRSEVQLFVSEVECLLSRSFVTRFREQDVCFSDSESLDTSPSIEQLEAFVLHFRKFLQENDRVAITRIRAHFEALMPAKEIMAEWTQLQTVFDEMKDSKAIVNRDLSLRDVFRARTFGDLSHLDNKQQKRHAMLSSTPQSEALYRFEYSTLLAETAELLEHMARLCKQFLGEPA